jgi:hypothetical protein
MSKIIRKKREAKALGLDRYYTGKLCKHGHDDERYMSTGECISCRKRVTNNWIDANKDAKDEYNREYARKRLLDPSNREKARAAVSKWQKDNPHKANAKCVLRKTRKMKATPSWLTQTQLKEIESFYAVAQWYDEPMHVDHIVPLKGKNVCGLHVPWNLQVITAKENCIKSNKHNSLGQSHGM